MNTVYAVVMVWLDADANVTDWTEVYMTSDQQDAESKRSRWQDEVGMFSPRQFAVVVW